MVIGGGGRENAIALSAVSSNNSIYSISHNNNPGLIGISKRHFKVNENDKEAVLSVAKRVKPDLVLIGPEDPLSNGVSDILISQGFKVFAPTSKAAKLETSKSFLRNFMKSHYIDGNVESQSFTDFNELNKWVMGLDYEFVLKPDGLTGGKGVLVQGNHFYTKEEGLSIAKKLFENGMNKLLVERKLIGEEFSLQALVYYDKILFLPVVQDYKRAGENDTGPNTGGMGSISFSESGLPFIPKSHVETAKSIMRKIMEAMHSEGTPYVGPIYGQFMSTKLGPKLIEINARFGDPEAINVLDLMDDSIVDASIKLMEGNTPTLNIKNQINVVRYIVPIGYGSDPKPSKLKIDEVYLRRKGLKIFYASVDKKGNYLQQTRSRSIALLAKGDSINEIIPKFDGMENAIAGNYYYRRDIGTFESIERKNKFMKDLLSS